MPRGWPHKNLSRNRKEEATRANMDPTELKIWRKLVGGPDLAGLDRSVVHKTKNELVDTKLKSCVSFLDRKSEWNSKICPGRSGSVGLSHIRA